MKIIIDKESEFQWIREIIDTGLLNISRDLAMSMMNRGIDLSQNILYEKSDAYMKDLEDEDRYFLWK